MSAYYKGGIQRELLFFYKVKKWSENLKWKKRSENFEVKIWSEKKEVDLKWKNEVKKMKWTIMKWKEF